jgi:flagellar motor switch/type III secretory pathway protein FliN
VQPTDDLRLVEDLPLLLDARIPCNPMSIRALSSMEPGTIITTSRAAGESVDISVSDQSIGWAELIVIENRLAIRLSDLTEKK